MNLHNVSSALIEVVQLELVAEEDGHISHLLCDSQDEVLFTSIRRVEKHIQRDEVDGDLGRGGYNYYSPPFPSHPHSR